MKKLLVKIEFGVAIGCFGFVSMLFIASAFAGGANAFIGQKTGEEMLRLAACFIIIAIGFSVPSLVYEKENLTNSLKVLIHMAAGTVVYLITAFFAGWIEKSFGAIVVYILIALGAAAIIWAILCLLLSCKLIKSTEKLERNMKIKSDKS